MLGIACMRGRRGSRLLWCIEGFEEMDGVNRGREFLGKTEIIFGYDFGTKMSSNTSIDFTQTRTIHGASRMVLDLL